MKIMNALALLVLLITVQSVVAVDHYVFQANEADDSEIRAYTQTQALDKLSWEGWIQLDPLVEREWQKHYIFEVTAGEYAAGWAALVQATKDVGKAAAQAERTDFTLRFNKLLKAFALVVLDNNNKTRVWISDFKTAVSNAGTLGDLKTSVAALPDMPSFSTNQLRTAVTNKYNSLP